MDEAGDSYVAAVAWEHEFIQLIKVLVDKSAADVEFSFALCLKRSECRV